MNKREMLNISFLSICLLLVPVSIHAAEREERWSEVLYFTASSGLAIPGDEGRYVGVWEMRGVAQFGDDNVAKMRTGGTLDLRRGTGPYTGYVLYTFSDGSTKFGKIEGVITKPMADGGNVQEGTLIYEGGSGRYTGIHGSGTFRARQYGPASDGGETVIDVVASFSLPK